MHIELVTASSDKSIRFWDARSRQTNTQRNIQLARISTSRGTTTARTSPSATKKIVISFHRHAHLQAAGKDQVSLRGQRDRVGQFRQALFFVTTGLGTVEVSSWPENKPLRTLRGHTAAVYCLAFSDRYFACGSADAVRERSGRSTSSSVLQDVCTSLEWPVRTLSFSHCGTYLAAASEDVVIDICQRRDGPARHRHSVQFCDELHRLESHQTLCWPMQVRSSNYIFTTLRFL
jgi:THO complex subunit 3